MESEMKVEAAIRLNEGDLMSLCTVFSGDACPEIVDRGEQLIKIEFTAPDTQGEVEAKSLRYLCGKLQGADIEEASLVEFSVHEQPATAVAN